MRSLFLLAFLAICTPIRAQDKTGGTGRPTEDTVIVFESPRPLLEDEDLSSTELANSLGLSASFSDYGLGGGFFYSRKLSSMLTATVNVDLTGAKGTKEFGFGTEVKLNSIYLMPTIVALQYRVFANSLGENVRPYITLGAGPVLVLTTRASSGIFPNFRGAQSDFVTGGYAGIGMQFGSDKKSNFGVNVRYYIIPYEKGVQSVEGETLTNFNALFLTGTYGFNF